MNDQSPCGAASPAPIHTAPDLHPPLDRELDHARLADPETIPDPVVREGRDLLTDAAVVMRSRRQLDQACLDLLMAPGLGGVALESLTAFITGSQLQAGLAAMGRLTGAAQSGPSSAGTDKGGLR